MRFFLFFILLGQFSCIDLKADPVLEFNLIFEEGIKSASYYETPKGHLLRYTCFRSLNRNPKGTVLFLQGRGTFLEFYRALIAPLLERDLDVWMYDLSGQGGSTRLLEGSAHDPQTVQYMQHVDSFDFYLDDLQAFIQNVFLPQSEGPLYLGGYSTGGHIGLRYLQKYSDVPFKKAFMISPLLALKLPLPDPCFSCLFWSASFFLNLEKYVAGKTHEDAIFTMSFEENPYTGDKESYEEMQELCMQYRPYVMGGISYGWLKAATNSLKSLWEEQALQAIQIPVFIATGEADQVVDIRYNLSFANQLKRSKHVIYPKGRHEIFRETPAIRQQWWSDFEEFLQLLSLMKTEDQLN
jgi:lysophospholipase